MQWGGRARRALAPPPPHSFHGAHPQTLYPPPSPNKSPLQDGWSQTWYNKDQSLELITTLNKYKTLGVLVGHTHGASVYSFNGTHGGAWGEGAGFVDVINAPATQKEDGQHNTLPSEFMVLEASMGAGGVGSFRVAQRVGSGWGTVQGIKKFTC